MCSRKFKQAIGYFVIPLLLIYPEIWNNPREVNISMLYMNPDWQAYMRLVSLFIISYIMSNLRGKVKTNLRILFGILCLLTFFLPSGGSLLHSLHLLFANSAFALFVGFLFRVTPASAHSFYVCVLFTWLCVMITDGHVSGTSELVIAIPSTILFTKYAV